MVRNFLKKYPKIDKFISTSIDYAASRILIGQTSIEVFLCVLNFWIVVMFLSIWYSVYWLFGLVAFVFVSAGLAVILDEKTDSSDWIIVCFGLPSICLTVLSIIPIRFVLWNFVLVRITQDVWNEIYPDQKDKSRIGEHFVMHKDRYVMIKLGL